MISLTEIQHIYLYPELTDMRLGLFGLRKKVIELEGEIEPNSLYMFCAKSKNQIKILEVNTASSWLYQNKLLNGKFVWPEKGGKSELTSEELLVIIQGSALLKRIELQNEGISLF